MIGIQLNKDRGAVAIWRETGPEVIAKNGKLRDLVAMAMKRPGIDSEIGVIAVPAWYNDEQRADILARAREAGIANPRLMNEPAAAVLAFGISKAEMPTNSIVLNLLNDGTFDVTVLALRENYVEVLATNGITGLNPAVTSDSEKFFAKIEPVIKRAIADAELPPKSIDAIILTGNTVHLRATGTLIESTFGRAPEEPPSPETAIAQGAAVYSRMITLVPDVKTQEPAATSSAGCLSVLVFAIVCAISLARFNLQ